MTVETPDKQKNIHQPDAKPVTSPNKKSSVFGMSSKIATVVLSLLLISSLLLGFYVYNQRRIIKSMESNAELATNYFLSASEAEQQTKTSQKVDLFLRNVRFHWSPKVYVDANTLNASAVPTKGDVVNFDNPYSFLVNVGESDITILPEVLEGMFNESVFNYPTSKMRDLNVEIVKIEKKHKIKLGGSLSYLLWIPFEMIVNLDIDKTTNTLVMTVDDLDVFGVVPATGLIKIKPFNLEKLLTLPKNNHLNVVDNKIMIKPFGLFPAPRINGQFEKLEVNSSHVVLGFASPKEVDESFGNEQTQNAILLKGGTSQFGRLQMANTDIKVMDKDTSDTFVFNLDKYYGLLSSSDIKMNTDDSIDITMGDWQ